MRRFGVDLAVVNNLFFMLVDDDLIFWNLALCLFDVFKRVSSRVHFNHEAFE